MSRWNFRVKLDLSNFYNDVRRFSWIFIDGAKMLKVVHMKEHIAKLLNITEPFHLLLNKTEYLPPNEDIRIVNENETILVSPGTELENGLQLSTEDTRICIKKEKSNKVKHKHSQTNISPIELNTTAVQTVSDEVLNKSQSEFSEFSAISFGKEDSEASSMVESKTTDVTVMEDFNIEQVPKRKRVRRRKKRSEEIQQSTSQEKENIPKKPKIIDSCTISFGKHIRFDSEETTGNKDAPVKVMNGSHTKTIQPTHELANLLSLGKCSTPLTFTNPRVKEEIKTEPMHDEELQLDASPENKNKMSVNERLQNGIKELDKDISKCSVMTTKPQLKDVIAFKMLKIGSDYTPQISDFVVAEVISYCAETSVYTFKILKGLTEVQVPVGKFTIVEDEEEHVMNDTITVNYAQIIEPRLVFSNTTSVPCSN
ncbi:uncharacterized protein LOC100877110 [Megachile rotundata]|uniref:uncharacterized protein LOC100877110 n=1 Tax=Megachile rotundata TaxID=143995 RepID=UPI003FCF0CB9